MHFSLWKRNNFVWKDIQIALLWATTKNLEDLHDWAGIQCQRQEEAFFFPSGMHKEISIIKHHSSLGQHVFLYWQAKWGISNHALLAYSHFLHSYCFNVFLAIRHLSIFGQWGMYFKEFWFCIKGYSYVSGITFIQQYLKNNYSLILAGHTAKYILYLKESSYNFHVISIIKIIYKGKNFQKYFLDSTLCFTLSYLTQLVKYLSP